MADNNAVEARDPGRREGLVCASGGKHARTWQHRTRGASPARRLPDASGAAARAYAHLHRRPGDGDRFRKSLAAVGSRGRCRGPGDPDLDAERAGDYLITRWSGWMRVLYA